MSDAHEGSKRPAAGEQFKAVKKVKREVRPDPNITLYVVNLNDKVGCQQLREGLFLMFTVYGDVVDINIKDKSRKMRGQAHVTFAKLESAKLAVRSLQGEAMFGKKIRISYSTNQNKKVVAGNQ